MDSPSVIATDQLVAFCIGIIWAVILYVYRAAIGTDIIRSLKNDRCWRRYAVVDILIVGGGTGVFLYLADSYLSAFVYGLAGVVLVTVVVAIGGR